MNSLLLNYGILGLFVAAMIPFIRSLIKREQDRADRLDAEVTRLNNLISEKTIPQLGSATTAINESTQATKYALDYIRALQYQKDVEAAAMAQQRNIGLGSPPPPQSPQLPN